MPTTAADFQRYLDAPEGDRLEFKSATGGFHFDKLTKYCVALANEGGGKIILGVTDRRPRSVVGTHAFEEPGRTEAGLYQRLHCRIEIEEFHHAGQRVLIVHVPSRPTGLALQYEGTYWMRAGDDLLAMSAERLREIFLEAGPDFSAEPSRATLADLDPVAIAEFRRRWAARGETARIQSWSDAELLRNAELQEGDAVLNAALVLFGTRAALGRHLAQAEIVFEYRSSEASGPAADRAEFREGFFLFHDALWQRINLRNDRQTIQEGFFLTEIPTFEERPIREAVLNAISHRDYRDGGSVFVRQYARRLEIISPGGFPPGISAETILDQQYPRNRRLAEALARCGLIERSGQGMNIMFEQSIRHSKPVPDFTGTTSREVHLTLHGTVTNPAFVRFLEKVGDERLASFSTHDFLALDAIQRGEPVPASIADAVPGLIEAGLIERQGRGKGASLFLSRGFYAALGKKGAYTRKKGLDHETNKELLLRHLRDAGATGAAMSEFLQVLPALTRDQVRGLMAELRSENRAVLVSKRAASRWFLASGSPGFGDSPAENPKNPQAQPKA